MEQEEARLKIKYALTAMTAVATLGIGMSAAPAAVAASPSQSPAVQAAAATVYHLNVEGCTGTEEIELRGTPAHDYMRETFGHTTYTCVVSVIDNGSVIFSLTQGSSSGSSSGAWYYDGPGHSMQVCLTVLPHGLDFGGKTCGPLN